MKAEVWGHNGTQEHFLQSKGEERLPHGPNSAESLLKWLGLLRAIRPNSREDLCRTLSRTLHWWGISLLGGLGQVSPGTLAGETPGLGLLPVYRWVFCQDRRRREAP